MPTFITYKITCLSNGKVYIGLTTKGLNKRWSQHVCQSKTGNTKLARAVQKYGVSAFSIEEFASAFDFAGLKLLEVFLIAQEDSYNNGLNTTKGGDGVLGNIHDQATRSKMSMAQKEINTRPETIKRRSDSAKKAWVTKSEFEREAHRIRASETMIQNQKNMSNKPQKAKPLLQFFGKGYNMKIKTHCPQGHAYDGENLFIGEQGSRVCKTCKRSTRNISRDRKRQQIREMKAVEIAGVRA